jgi:hypothetical protein
MIKPPECPQLFYLSNKPKKIKILKEVAKRFRLEQPKASEAEPQSARLSTFLTSFTLPMLRKPIKLYRLLSRTHVSVLMALALGVSARPS